MSTAGATTVGLTGGLASGKSSVASLLAGMGVPVFDADRCVHDLYASGQEGAEVVASLFGAEVLAADGRVDRGALARRVLSDDEARGRLEARIHPLVRRRTREWIDEGTGHELVVVEAALLVETGAWKDYDRVLVVWCPPEVQLARALARGVPELRARALIAAQASLEDRRRVADVLIDNSGAVELLPALVAKAWQEVRTLSGRGPA